MNPITHLFISWSTANIDSPCTRTVQGSLERRDRALITIGGILPDIDAFGFIPEWLSGGKIDWYSKYHHMLGHNISLGVLGLVAAILLAKKKAATAMLFIFTFHLHLFCDIIGARAGWIPMAYSLFMAV
jgi:hypothetical protein